MQANRFDGCPPTSFLTLLICLQCSVNNFRGGNVSSDRSHVARNRVDLLRAVFSL